MNKHLELQKEFQVLADQSSNVIPDIETRKLRLELALEELCELAEAFGLYETFSFILYKKLNKLEYLEKKDTEIYNAIEVLDALIDIEVINNGSIISCEFEEIFDREYENVDTNNKTKFHTDYWEADETKKYYISKGIQVDIHKIIINDYWYYVIKNEYGKVLKPYNYESVKLNLNK